MIFSDNEILAHPEMVSPFIKENVQPASIDLTLDESFRLPSPNRRPATDDFFRAMFPPEEIDMVDIEGFYRRNPLNRINGVTQITIGPGEFILGSTVEKVNIPDNVVARVEGKSSLARIGLLVHSTAGYIDSGFNGKITLEFYNLNNRAIILRPGKKICQLSFETLTSPASKPYGHPDLNSKYQNQSGVTESRYV